MSPEKKPTPEAQPPAVPDDKGTAVEQWTDLPAFDDGTAAFVEHFGLTAPRLKTDFGKNGNGFVDEQTGEVRKELNLVMLAFPPSRSWWAKALSEGGEMNAPPDCYSTIGALTVPDADVPERQSETCGVCPHSKWNDGEAPRCSEAVNVFAYDRDQESYFWVRFKRTSLKPFRAYVSSLMARRRPLFSVATKVTLKPGDKKGFEYLVPVFSAGEELTPTNVAPMREVTQQAMKSWTAIAEEMAASERGGEPAAPEFTDEKWVDPDDPSGEPF